MSGNSKKRSNAFDDDEDFFSMEEEKKAINKTFIYLQDIGTAISVFDLHTIEKDERFVDGTNPHVEYGITINKGMVMSEFVRKVDISLWYLKSKTRDEKFDALMDAFISEGLSVITV